MQKTVSVCDTHISRSSVPSAEAALWGAKISTLITDALFPFKLPGKETPYLDAQYKALIKKKRLYGTKLLVPYFIDDPVKCISTKQYRIGQTSKQSAIDAALYFFESEAFDICLGYIGLENDVDRIFAFIQKATTLRKKYNVACMKRQMLDQKIKISDLDERARKYIKGVK